MKRELFYLIMIIISVVFYILMNRKVVVTGLQIASGVVSRSSKLQTSSNTLVIHNNGILYIYSKQGTLQNKIITNITGSMILFENFAYINNYSQNSILKVDIITGEQNTIGVPVSPWNSCFDGNNLFIVFPYGNSIVYDTFQEEITQTVPIKNLSNCLYDGNLFWYLSEYNLLGNTGNLDQTFSTPSQPINLDSDGDNVFVLCSNNLSKYSPEKNILSIPLTTDTYQDLCLDKNSVYVLSVGKIYIFDKNTLTLKTSINVATCMKIRCDGSSIYIISQTNLYIISKSTYNVTTIPY